MITKSDAEAYLRGEKTIDELDNSQSNSKDSPNNLDSNTTLSTEEISTSETNTSEFENENSSETEENKNVVSSDNSSNSPEKTTDDNYNKNEINGRKKRSFTPEEMQKHAFAKEKNKRKEVQAKLEAKQKEIEELQEKLKKYEGLKREHFGGDDDAYTDYKIDQRLDKEKMDRMVQEYNFERNSVELEEAQEIADYRLQSNFPDETERDTYTNLVSNAEINYDKMHPEIGYKRFSDFLMSENDRTVLQYLQDTDNSPKLIRHFIHKPESVKRIMEMKNPYNKIVELKQLENRMLQFEKIQASKHKNINKNVGNERREIPNTGKVITNNVSNPQIDWNRPWSKSETETYLKNKRK